MFFKRLTYATAIPIIMMIVAMVLRPLWRDEVWALYFSDTGMALSDLLADRMSNDTHPPLYFAIQHFWRSVSENILWTKFFSLLVLGLGGLLGYFMGKDHKRETVLFFLMCLGSYWVIYFMAEIRPYILLFTLCALSVIYIRRVTTSPMAPLSLLTIVGWSLLTCLISLTHYYGGVWMGVSGGALAIHGLYMKKPYRFFGFGFATAIGLIPVCYWIYTNLGTINFGDEQRTAAEYFTFGFNQFRRGITDKTLGSNLALSIIAILAFPRLYRQREASDTILALSALILVLIVFFIHVFVQPLIKERAFIVIIPALIYLMARAILLSLDADTVHPRLKQAVMWLAIISPFLFMSEYFKDREKTDQVRAVFTQNLACERAPIAAYYRPSPQGNDFSEFYTRLVLKDLYKKDTSLNLVNIKDLTPQIVADILNSSCPVKAVALNLPRGDKPDHAAYRQALETAGIPYTTLQKRVIGKGRNILYLDTEPSLHAQ